MIKMNLKIKSIKNLEAIKNQNISCEDLISDISAMQNSKLIIIGDLIIDQYSGL